MFHQMNLLIKWFNGNVPFLCYLNIYSIIVLIVLLPSAFLAQADVINNLNAEIEVLDLSQPNISSIDEQNYLQNDIIFFRILEQIDDGLMIGILLGENIYTPLIIQPIISFDSNQLIGMPLFSNTCWAIPLLNEEKQHIWEEEYLLFMNHFYE
ncbi:MAG: hypothetical protein VSS52_004895 [Thiotrichaceae bacterium]|nr:hypothetical protein [Thiotrichaceae bacterium]